MQTRVLYDASNRCIRDRGFVDVLEEVDDADEWHDVQVDLSQQSFACFRVYRLTETACFFEQMESGIGAVSCLH